jgi:hypothetical protein
MNRTNPILHHQTHQRTANNGQTNNHENPTPEHIAVFRLALIRLLDESIEALNELAGAANAGRLAHIPALIEEQLRERRDRLHTVKNAALGAWVSALKSLPGRVGRNCQGHIIGRSRKLPASPPGAILRMLAEAESSPDPRVRDAAWQVLALQEVDHGGRAI